MTTENADTTSETPQRVPECPECLRAIGFGLNGRRARHKPDLIDRSGRTCQGSGQVIGLARGSSASTGSDL